MRADYVNAAALHGTQAATREDTFLTAKSCMPPFVTVLPNPLMLHCGQVRLYATVPLELEVCLFPPALDQYPIPILSRAGEFAEDSNSFLTRRSMKTR